MAKEKEVITNQEAVATVEKKKSFKDGVRAAGTWIKEKKGVILAGIGGAVVGAGAILLAGALSNDGEDESPEYYYLPDDEVVYEDEDLVECDAPSEE